MSVLQEFVPEVIISQKCFVNMDAVLSIWGMGIWNPGCFML